MSTESNSNVVASRSTFVSVTAWIFIVLSAFMTFSALMQNVMVTLMFSNEELVQAVNREPNAPPGMAIVFGHLRLILVLFMALSAGSLVASIGLLRRREWGRILFIAMLLLGILWMMGGFALQVFVMSSVSAMPVQGGAAVEAQFGLMMKVLTIVAVLISLMFAAIFGLIIRKLMSPDIRREFGPG